MQSTYYILILIAQLGSTLGKGPIVTIPDGTIEGTMERTVTQKTYFAYRGIPFAEPPIGDLRFAPPQKNHPWKGTLNATVDKARCPQIDTNTGTDVLGSEDCLHLGVYSPLYSPDPKGKLLPVMVHFYGGGFVTGAYDYLKPDYLIEKEVVYVGFNYRLGILGFLSTGDIECPGNNGLRDQIMALKWVKRNIRYFGGDPDRVTIFGESAGGASISYLLQTDKAKGLYNRAILQSGTNLCVWSLTLNARQMAFLVGEALGIAETTSSALVASMKKIDYKSLIYVPMIFDTEAVLKDYLTRGLAFGPVIEVDHFNAIVTGKSHQKLLNGNFQQIPLIIGFTSNEAGYKAQFLSFLPQSRALFESDVTKFAPDGLTQNTIKKNLVGAQVRDRFIGNNMLISQLTNFGRFISVEAYSRAIRETVRLMSKFTDIFYYQFAYEGVLGNENPAKLYPGVAHGEDSHYIFARSDIRTSSVMDMITKDRIVTMWTNFAKTGNPTPPCNNDSVLGDLVWKPNNRQVDTDLHINYLNINRTLEMKSNPIQSDWEFYLNLFQLYGDPPFSTY